MLENISKIKYYIIGILLAFGGYVWSSSYGVKVIGDDKEEQEERSTAGGRSHFYHK